MLTLETHEINLPDWSCSAIFNGDTDSLREVDVDALDAFLEEWRDKARELEGQLEIVIGDGDPFFSGAPAFGLPCTCYNAEILILK